MIRERKMKNGAKPAVRPEEARSVEISAPGAAIKIERLTLTPDEEASLSVNTRLSDLDFEEVRKAA
ncbi:MAG TPA: hypothetical protein VGI80_09050 [Pyrinomonadaceae bacterium]